MSYFAWVLKEPFLKSLFYSKNKNECGNSTFSVYIEL